MYSLQGSTFTRFEVQLYMGGASRQHNLTDMKYVRFESKVKSFSYDQ